MQYIYGFGCTYSKLGSQVTEDPRGFLSDSLRSTWIRVGFAHGPNLTLFWTHESRIDLVVLSESVDLQILDSPTRSNLNPVQIRYKSVRESRTDSDPNPIRDLDT